MDSMTEIFYDESNHILQNMRRSLLIRTENGGYGQEVVQELFRGVHTLKADSAMMLYEDMADVSKALESLLHCFRGPHKEVEDADRFAALVEEYLDFFEDETDKLSKGIFPDGSGKALEDAIQKLTAECTVKMKEDEREQYQKEISKPQKQVFYIPGAGQEIKKEEALVQQEDSKTVEKVSRKRYVISDEARERICQASRELLRITGKIQYSSASEEKKVITEYQLDKLITIQKDLESVRQELANTNFVPVAKKMEILVEEMSDKLKKPVKLLVKGEETLVNREQREKISGALTHIIRNAVDHGIETMEIRERFGKSPMGLIRLRFAIEDGRLRVSVKDDGAGIDTQKILEKAQKDHLLTKAPEEYTEKEILNLILLNGVTTSDTVGEYSGRGVGMDVINHNVLELGGKLKISTKKGLGTTVTMKF